MISIAGIAMKIQHQRYGLVSGIIGRYIQNVFSLNAIMHDCPVQALLGLDFDAKWEEKKEE